MPSGGAKNKKRDSLVSALLEKSEAWGAGVGLYPKGKEPKTKMSKTSKEIHNIINNAKFGCQEDAVRMICSKLLTMQGETPLPKSKSGDQSIRYQPGVVVVPSSGRLKGEPCLLLSQDGGCLGTDGKEVSKFTLSTTRDSVRLATEVEVTYLLDSVKKKYPDKLELAALLVEGY